jgi:hypothetical protein
MLCHRQLPAPHGCMRRRLRLHDRNLLRTRLRAPTPPPCYGAMLATTWSASPPSPSRGLETPPSPPLEHQSPTNDSPRLPLRWRMEQCPTVILVDHSDLVASEPSTDHALLHAAMLGFIFKPCSSSSLEVQCPCILFLSGAAARVTYHAGAAPPLLVSIRRLSPHFFFPCPSLIC